LQVVHATLTFIAGMWEHRAAVLAPRFLANYKCRADAGDDEAFTSCFKPYLLGPATCTQEKYQVR
jgi:hypothetical protein